MPLRTMFTGIFVRIAVLSLALGANAAAQSAAADSMPATGPAESSLFERVIANQKKADDALDVYERIERVEVRKNANDPIPSTVKISRVIPSGTGMDRIPVGPDGKPTDAAAYRAELEKLERALALIVEGSRSQRDGLEKFAKRKRNAKI